MRRVIVVMSLIFIFILPSCGVLQQVGEMKMLQKCEFRIGSVTEITLAGVNISRMQNYSELHIPDAIEIVSAMMTNELPLSFILNLEVRNPNSQRASLNRMEWTVFIDELQMLEGLVEHSFTIEPESIGTLPVHINLNLKDHFDKLNLDQVKKIAFGLTDDGNKPLRIMLRIKPSIMVGTRTINYPGTIDTKRDFVF